MKKKRTYDEIDDELQDLYRQGMYGYVGKDKKKLKSKIKKLQRELRL